MTTDFGWGSSRTDRALRDVLARYATGVAVVTAVNRGRMIGLTVNSFTSVSIAPPIVLWCLRHDSASHAAFAGAELFAVNVLADDQQALADQFAQPRERFHAVALRPNRRGVPLLDGAVATLICRRKLLVPAGDHTVFFGTVLDCFARRAAPLLFFGGEYHSGRLLVPVPTGTGIGGE